MDMPSDKFVVIVEPAVRIRVGFENKEVAVAVVNVSYLGILLEKHRNKTPAFSFKPLDLRRELRTMHTPKS